MTDLLAANSKQEEDKPGTKKKRLSSGGIVHLRSLSPDDIPTISESGTRGIPVVGCMICGQKIDIRGKERQYVVKCEVCQEATPIRPPPSDKKYVRCICNSLLICRTGALRIICPRSECHRILDIGQRRQISSLQGVGMVRVACVFCDRNFLFNTLDKRLAHCPHCAKRSSVGKKYARKSGIMYLVIAVLFIITGVIVTAETSYVVVDQPGVIAVYVCLFAMGIIFVLQSIYYFTLPVSPILGPF